MGVLDDAIKEHLELKRKHGASEEEVERQQEEALGPVRREAAQQPESVESEAEGSDGEAVVADPAAEVPADAASPAPADADGEQLFDGETLTAEEPPPAKDEGPEQSAPVADEPPLAVPAEEPVVEPPEEPVLEEDPEAPEPAGGAGDTPPRGLEPVEEPRGSDPGATVEYDPFADEEPDKDQEEPAASEEEEGDGDVLEDTPDFLQETPEHDRLWFEQKPPRDFDFE